MDQGRSPRSPPSGSCPTNSIPYSLAASWICGPSIDSSGGTPAWPRGQRDRTVELPVPRRRQDQIAGGFRLDAKAVHCPTGDVRERARARPNPRLVADVQRDLAFERRRRTPCPRGAGAEERSLPRGARSSTSANAPPVLSACRRGNPSRHRPASGAPPRRFGADFHASLVGSTKRASSSSNSGQSSARRA